jgi:class 3 adenylate cyclase
MSTLQATPPHHRVILAVDIEGSTMRTNTAKAGLRHVMYALLEECLIISGVQEDHRDSFIDRGDGILVLIHPVDEVPKTLLLSMVAPTLETLLCQHADEFPEQELRLRVVVHAGEVHYDGRGCFGESLDVAFRLLDAAEVKERFRRTRAPLILVVSDDIHQMVIRHGYEGIDQQAFVPAAYVNVAGQVRLGWIKEAIARRGPSLLAPEPS